MDPVVGPLVDRVAVRWRPRAVPLDVVAVAAVGGPARALATRLLARGDDALAAVRGVAGDDVLVLLGPADALPWADDVVWLGRDPRAPSLLLPTSAGPDVAPELLERALVARAGGRTPLAVLPSPPRLVPVDAARPVDRARLLAWLG